MWPFKNRPQDIPAGIQEAVAVTEFEPGQFIIFEMGNDLTYVQFSIRPIGLHCYWPRGVPAIDKHEARFAELLSNRGCIRLEVEEPTSAEVLDRFRPGQYAVLEDGYYLQVGRDAEIVQSFIEDVFDKVFQVSQQDRLKITLAHHA